MCNKKISEMKLVAKPGVYIRTSQVLDACRKFLGVSDIIIGVPLNMVYEDTYFDDQEFTLLKQGGSLKIRTGILKFGCTKTKLSMRTLTKNPQKLKVTLWDEAEVSAEVPTVEKVDFSKNLQSFFPEFNFGKIDKTPVLVCTTMRTEYCINVNADLAVKIIFDHLEYQAGGKEAVDDLLKIRSRSASYELIDALYQHLENVFWEYEMNCSSRYERAIEKLNVTC